MFGLLFTHSIRGEYVWRKVDGYWALSKEAWRKTLRGWGGFLLTFQKGFTHEDSRALKDFFVSNLFQIFPSDSKVIRQKHVIEQLYQDSSLRAVKVAGSSVFPCILPCTLGKSPRLRAWTGHCREDRTTGTSGLPGREERRLTVQGDLKLRKGLLLSKVIPSWFPTYRTYCILSVITHCAALTEMSSFLSSYFLRFFKEHLKSLYLQKTLLISDVQNLWNAKVYVSWTM